MSRDLFGVPYQGSKSRIARTIHRQLPSGKRFVDLFGGGFAMSHAALLLPDKYESVLYNDIYKPVTELVRKAIDGEYSYTKFQPEWISKDEFKKRKETDAYIKYCWSFGNDGENYLYGPENERLKKEAHNLVVFGRKSQVLEKIARGVNDAVNGKTIEERRMQFQRYMRSAGEKGKPLVNIQALQILERLKRLQQLQGLKRFHHLEISNISYKDYKYRQGDVVYCDPPYEGTEGYNKQKFNFKEFYDWAISRPYQIWFSSYNISDNRFRLVYAKMLRGTMPRGGLSVYNYEKLYTNK